MKQLAKLFSGIVIGSIAGIAATIIFSPKKRTEWFDEIQDRTEVEIGRASCRERV